MNRNQIFNVILHYLTQLRLSIEQFNSLNFQDINVHSENFFRDLLNLAFGYELININIVEKNARSIDLGDEKGRIAIQVTSTSDLSKIKHTHKGFLKSGLDKKYDRLIVLIIGKKPRYRESRLGVDDVFELSLESDVWDITELLRKIGDLPLNKLERCCEFLREQLDIVKPRQSNEVCTLIRLIEVLSSAEDCVSVGKNREDPDPDRKIYNRFADHAAFLVMQYVELYEIYGLALNEVNKHSDLGHVRVRKLQIYLMNWSDRVLTEHGDDPKAALSALTKNVLRMMGTSADAVAFDDGAIRFYLIDQLIACNVFPNKQALDA